MKYQTAARFHEEELKAIKITEEDIYRDLVRRMINYMPIEEVKKIFKMGWEWDGIDTVRYQVEIETDK